MTATAQADVRSAANIIDEIDAALRTYALTHEEERAILRTFLKRRGRCAFEVVLTDSISEALREIWGDVR